MNPPPGPAQTHGAEVAVPASLYLRLSVTDACNLRCRYCRPARARPVRSHEPRLDDAQLTALVEQIAEAAGAIGKIRITGGEPLLRPELPELVRRLRRHFPDAELCLTTNGMLLKSHAAPLRDAGLDRINVSLDTCDPEQFETLTGGARPEPVLAGLDAAAAAGFTGTKLNTVLLRSFNGDHLADLVRIATDRGAEARFIELMPFGAARTIHGSDYLSAEEALQRLGRSFRYLRSLGRQGTAQRHLLQNGGDPFAIGFIMPVSHPFCSTCDRLRLDSHGRLFACLRQATGVDLAAHLHAGDDEGLRERIRELLISKTGAPKSWPRHEMSAIGG